MGTDDLNVRRREVFRDVSLRDVRERRPYRERLRESLHNGRLWAERHLYVAIPVGVAVTLGTCLGLVYLTS